MSIETALIIAAAILVFGGPALFLAFALLGGVGVAFARLLSVIVSPRSAYHRFRTRNMTSYQRSAYYRAVWAKRRAKKAR